MKTKPYNRRDLFKSFGASALLLHPILSSREGYAENAVKKRFFTMMTSSGVVQSNFWPKGNSASYDFTGTTLEVLSPFKSDLSLVKGLRNDYGPFDSHSGGAVSLLTGNWLNTDGCNKASCDFHAGDTFAKSASIDQMIAKYYSGKTAVSSLVLGLFPTSERPSKYISYDEAGKVVPLATNPYTVFNAIFKDIIQSCDSSKLDPAALAKIKSKRKSILDAINADLADAVKQVGLNAEEKAKLAFYQDSIRQIEATIDSAASSTAASCNGLKAFTTGPQIAVKAENYAAIAKLMMDLIVAAFQLDITRSATLVWSVGGGNGVPSTWETFNGQPIVESYHALTHHQVDPVNFDPKLKILDEWHASQFAYLIGQLKASKEGSSTLLDNSLALWTSEIGEGSSHTSLNMPFVLAGKAGGAMKTGRYLQLPQTEHHGALVSILNAMGLATVKGIGRFPLAAPILLT